MENNLRNQTETQNPSGLDWLWILWAVLYSVGFAFACVAFAIENAPVVFFVGLVALAALKYLIRFPG
jgi:hypothetical protein